MPPVWHSNDFQNTNQTFICKHAIWNVKKCAFLFAQLVNQLPCILQESLYWLLLSMAYHPHSGNHFAKTSVYHITPFILYEKKVRSYYIPILYFIIIIIIFIFPPHSFFRQGLQPKHTTPVCKEIRKNRARHTTYNNDDEAFSMLMKSCAPREKVPSMKSANTAARKKQTHNSFL